MAKNNNQSSTEMTNHGKTSQQRKYRKTARKNHIGKQATIKNRFSALSDNGDNETKDEQVIINMENPTIMQEKDANQQETAERQTIFNLSNYTLTDAERNLLERGLKFVPTKPNVNISKLLADLREWERRMTEGVFSRR